MFVNYDIHTMIKSEYCRTSLRCVDLCISLHRILSHPNLKHLSHYKNSSKMHAFLLKSHLVGEQVYYYQFLIPLYFWTQM